MKSKFIYVPIVKWKKGEQEALRELDDSIKKQIIPLIELTPDINFSKFQSTLDYWENKHFYFDVIPEFYEENNGEVYFELLKQCDPEYVIPVVFLSDNLSALKEAYNYSNNGIAIRITNNDFEGLENDLNALKDNFTYENIDLIIDLKEINKDTLSDRKIILKAILPDIPDIKSFRNIIIAGSSFPQSLSDIEKYEPVLLDRYEYKFWESTKDLASKYNINLLYSDYCVNHPSFFQFIIGMSPSFNIRYSCNDSFLIMKGDSLKKGGLESDNVIRFCEKLINSGEFSGKEFSWGDNYIYTRCKDDAKSFGNLTTWRKVGTNHHITLVVNQLSNLV